MHGGARGMHVSENIEDGTGCRSPDALSSLGSLPQLRRRNGQSFSVNTYKSYGNGGCKQKTQWNKTKIRNVEMPGKGAYMSNVPGLAAQPCDTHM